MSPSGSERQAGTASESKAGAQDAFQSFAETTTRFVKQAASILEEEIAAGIGLAKQVEAKFLDVEKLRSGKPDEVMQRFRRDAHELVDILIDALQGTLSALGGLAQKAVKVRAGATPGTMEPGKTTTVELDKPVKAGEVVEIPLTLANDSDEPTPEFHFYPTEFVSQTGDRIPAEAVQCSPPAVVIPPRATERVTIRVQVPPNTPPGVYSGLLQANKLGQLRAVLILTVE